MESTLQRLKKFIDSKDIKISRVEQELGFSNGSLASQIKKGKTIGVDKLENILNHYPELNPIWLLTGREKMLKADMPVGTTLKSDEKGIPLLPFDAFAGIGDLMVNGIPDDAIVARYEVPLFEGLEIDFMIPVRGSSMYPKYSSGDVVACRMIHELLFLQWNKVHVIDTFSQGVLMKRIKKGSNDNTMVCKSDNPEYDDFEIPRSDVRRIALVVGVIRIE